jgi:RecA-family ATPase
VTVRAEQRHKRSRPCLICGGGDDDPRGKEKRCSGFISDDGEWEHCSREELAGSIAPDPNGVTYAHRMHGPCRCGQIHGEARSGTRPANDNVERTYVYTDEEGQPLFHVVRTYRDGRKGFHQERPNGTKGLGDVRRTIYRLHRVVKADPSRTVYVVEGEKDVDTLEQRGEVATCNPMGAEKWKYVADEAAKALRGRVVVVIADADEPGRKHAKDVSERLQGIAKSVRVLECPAPHNDVSDYLTAGGDFATLVAEPSAAVDDLAPEIPFDELWTPEPDTQKVIPWLGIVPGPVHLVTGSWYTGKTLLLMTMGLAVASGRDLFGLHGVQRGKWTHFDHEMGRRGAKRYIQRVARGLGLKPEDVRDRVSVRVLPRLNLTTEGAVDHYTRLLTGSLIATIDPLRAAAPGQDENKSEFRQWLDMLAVVSDRTGCAIIVLHHGGKPVEGTERRNTGRGTSAIDDAVQTKIVLTAAEKGAPMLVSHEKTRENNGTTVEDFYLEMDNSDPEAVRLVHRDMEEMAERLEAQARAKEGPAIAKTKQAIGALLAKMGGSFSGSRDELKKLVGGKGWIFDKAWVELTRVDRSVWRDGPKNEPVWKLGNDHREEP